MASDGSQAMPTAHYPIYGVRGWYAKEDDKSNGGGYSRSGSQQAPARRLESSQFDSSTQRYEGRGKPSGVWDGPAPRGVLPPGLLSSPITTYTRKPPGATTTMLPGGGKMPFLGMSTEGTTEEVLKKALELGYRHFDCNPEDGNEAMVGSVLNLNASSVPREDLFVTSKLPNDMHGHVKEACEASLKALGVACLDLYLVAWPVAWKKGTQVVDETCSLEQTWVQMEALVDAGLVKYIGLANFDLPQVERMLSACRIKPAALQVELHPLLAQRKLVGVCKRKGLAIIAHHPLGDANLAANVAVIKVAGECSRKPVEALLRWNLERCVGVTVPGTDATQVAEGAGSITFSLMDEEKRQLDALDALNLGQRSVNPSFMTFAAPGEGGAIKPSSVLGYA
mmetsp:Transcript_5117/g.8896  ORF Transcript_5117/g.8896 Transcript_5117/m.8896 type:complete len:395 (+) Transcript_5117:216-1400(+)|eukprot:CAMPEP_0198216452 /NCGR_PEP_ID=MMETSP1445-20131203/57477_1 /TAXON_ID=36898 /ORGANISM="Pyramimonas sp., Strain CCMP2087" /LENGTH=394 /DNA_ID=CAMNT_0043892687 /DNA_START=186 /DNA_END=1370 /DNA_ORIENTATION=+